MFEQNPHIMQFYPFYKDEWNRITYDDYVSPAFVNQVGNSWFVLFRLEENIKKLTIIIELKYLTDLNLYFRDVFHASKPVFLLPKLYTNMSNCILKVINNDTYQEIPKVFNKVCPFTYTRNKVPNNTQLNSNSRYIIFT